MVAAAAGSSRSAGRVVFITLDKLDKLGRGRSRRRAARRPGTPRPPSTGCWTSMSDGDGTAERCGTLLAARVRTTACGARSAAHHRRRSAQAAGGRFRHRVRPDPRPGHGLLHRAHLRDRSIGELRRRLHRGRRALRRHDRPLHRAGRARHRLLDRLRARDRRSCMEPGPRRERDGERVALVFDEATRRWPPCLRVAQRPAGAGSARAARAPGKRLGTQLAGSGEAGLRRSRRRSGWRAGAVECSREPGRGGAGETRHDGEPRGAGGGRIAAARCGASTPDRRSR